MTKCNPCTSLASSLNRRVTIQSLATAADAHGQLTETWSDLYQNLPAEILGVAGGERVRGQQIEAGITSLVKIRYPRGTLPAASMRLLVGTGTSQRTLNIARVLDRDGWRRELYLQCMEVDDG